jgi:hypothetical protein
MNYFGIGAAFLLWTMAGFAAYLIDPLNINLYLLGFCLLTAAGILTERDKPTNQPSDDQEFDNSDNNSDDSDSDRGDDDPPGDIPIETKITGQDSTGHSDTA